jgi:hypothetical protein
MATRSDKEPEKILFEINGQLRPQALDGTAELASLASNGGHAPNSTDNSSANNSAPQAPQPGSDASKLPKTLGLRLDPAAAP